MVTVKTWHTDRDTSRKYTRTGEPREGGEAREPGAEAGAEYEAEADLETLSGPDVNNGDNGDIPLALDQVRDTQCPYIEADGWLLPGDPEECGDDPLRGHEAEAAGQCAGGGRRPGLQGGGGLPPVQAGARGGGELIMTVKMIMMMMMMMTGDHLT